MSYHFNFHALANYEIDLCNDQSDMIYPHSDNYLVDQKIPAKLQKNGLIMLETFIKYNESFTEDKKYHQYILKQMKNNSECDKVSKLCVYRYNSMKLIYTLVKTNDDCGVNECFVALDNDNYIIVGTANCHPFVITREFTYDNSDGSGPERVTKKYDVQNITKQFKKYYKEFCGNSYH